MDPTPGAPAWLVASWVTLKLAGLTTLILLLLGMPLAWWLAHTRSRWRLPVGAVVALPMVLPPTVLGFYLLIGLGPDGPLGRLTETLARDDGNPIDGLRAMALFVIDRVANDPRHSRMMAISWHKCEYVGEMAVIRDTHIECGARYLTLGEECFRKAIDRGYFPKDMDPHVASLGMMVIVDGLIATWTLYDDLFPLADYATRIMDAYLAGLQRPAGAPAGARIPPAAAGG